MYRAGLDKQFVETHSRVMAREGAKVVARSKRVHALNELSSLDPTVVLSLNNAHAKETSELAEASLAALLEMAFYARGIDRGTTAFLIALDHNAPYANPNFKWFKATRE
jgi:predicted GNAT superfamily acetyltransferase